MNRFSFLKELCCLIVSAMLIYMFYQPDFGGHLVAFFLTVIMYMFAQIIFLRQTYPWIKQHDDMPLIVCGVFIVSLLFTTAVGFFADEMWPWPFLVGLMVYVPMSFALEMYRRDYLSRKRDW